MNKFKRGYALKAAGLLLLMGVFAAASFLGPALRRAPEPGLQLPTMTNIPPPGSLHIETAAEPQPAPEAPPPELQ